MDERVKKIGDIWVTPETLNIYFPKECVVKCNVIEMKLSENFPILLRKKTKIQYEVFGRKRKDYERVLSKIKEANYGD